jgi:starch-binding outer membrane protein, SusD/RagB family
MKSINKFLLLTVALTLFSCESLVDGINDNPNAITTDKLEAGVLLLKGIQLASVGVQVGHQARIGSMWCGQSRGVLLLYKSIAEYNISAEETNGMWQNAYQGIIKQSKVMREQTASSPLAKLYSGITKTLEAQTFGTLASLFGDIPFTEAANDAFPSPKFESQRKVLNSVQTLLDEAIAELNAAPTGSIPEDLFYAGNKTRWIKAAYTIKARFFMLTREYSKALESAKNGILLQADAMVFTPPAIGVGSTNTYFKLIDQRAGYWGFPGSFLETMLRTARNHIKTNEAARLTYVRFDGNTANNNRGIAARNRPQILVGYEENLLYLAEAEARLGNQTGALTNLNTLRAHFQAGRGFEKLVATDSLRYTAFTLQDFEAGGIENRDNKTVDIALLREIIQERYVTTFLTHIPFEDLRRLSTKERDIAVLPPFNVTTATKYPQRFIVAQSELSANPNAPSDPGIFAETEVNK